MGLFSFRLPDVGEGVAEAEITAWHVKTGDRIEEDDPLVDVMTDKATVEMTSPVGGTIAALHGDVGQMVPVGSVLVEIRTDGDQAEEDASEAPAPQEGVPEAEEEKKSGPEPSEAPSQAGSFPLAAPATRRRALELGIPLDAVEPTGSGGRILPADLEAYLALHAAPQQRHARRNAVHAIKIVGLRRKIAERMERAARSIPHFSYVEEIDMTELEALRTDLNASRGERPKLTLLPFLIQAVVRLRSDFPNVNARYDEAQGTLEVHEAIHVGIATQTRDGLIVPVLRHAEARDLWDMAAEIARISGTARDGSAPRDMLQGSTITLTSLGRLGGIAATPIINAPEVAILGPNRLVERPVVRNGRIESRVMMNLSSSFDHRIIDGYEAASFVRRIKQLLERPALLFIPQ